MTRGEMWGGVGGEWGGMWGGHLLNWGDESKFVGECVGP